jgi:ProP effector
LSRAEKKRRYMAALGDIETALEAHWPKTFSLDQTRRRPLKVGIYDDLVAAGVELTPRALSRALRVYCLNKFYLDRLRPNALRIDLNGEPSGFVNSIDAKRAADELARRRAKAAGRRDAACSTGPVHSSPAPMSERPRRLSLADLKQHALARKGAVHDGF